MAGSRARSSRSGVRLALVSRVVGVATLSVSPHAQSQKNAVQPEVKRLSRSEHLRPWVDAIERHKPGAEDEALGVFDAWQSDSLAYLAIDIDTLLKLIHLGRVLGLRGEHAETEELLRRAVADTKEPLLQYYANLFE